MLGVRSEAWLPVEQGLVNMKKEAPNGTKNIPHHDEDVREVTEHTKRLWSA
jgi:hypothetical protein